MTGADRTEGVVDDPTNRRAGHSGAIRQWLAEHLPPGKTLSLGSEEWPLSLTRDDHAISRVVQLAPVLKYEEIFDHAWVNDGLTTCADPVTVTRNIFWAMKPGGSLVATVPHGLSGGGTEERPFYLGSLRRLLEPLFELTEIGLLDGFIVAAARRREQPVGTLALTLDAAEEAFRDHDRRLNARLDLAASELSKAHAQRHAATQETRKAKANLKRTTRELERTRQSLGDLRRKVDRLKWWLAIPLAFLRAPRRIWRLVRGARATDQSLTARHDRHAGHAPLAADSGAPAHGINTGEPARTPAAHTSSWRDRLQAAFEAWLLDARSSEGDEVIVMFSGTTFVQDHRGNRPIRLSKVYLSRNCPVFFNYYRWSQKASLPEYPDKLLFQSPIDATPDLLYRLLAADFGRKKKIFFASFPHETMVRHLTLAAQLGWVTVYDVRDDWDEFAKVGMATWHHPGYEHYIATQADVVSTVSRPLAQKVSALAGGRTVHVVPNGLDSQFPRPAERDTPGTSTIGYFGHLTDRWFDWALVIEAARRYPSYTFELAGHQQPDLQLPANIRLLGLLSHSELADRSRNWALAVIPFKNGPLADSVDPIKVYEYLHLGLPVLATYFPQCRDYPGTTITEGREEFLEKMPGLVGTTVPRDEVDSWLSQNTWDRRVDTYSNLAAEARSNGRSGIANLLGGSW